MSTASDDCSSAKQPPSASSALEAKKAVPCCRPVMMPVSIMRSSRRAIVRIHASRCAFISCVNDLRLKKRPDVACENRTQSRMKTASAEASVQWKESMSIGPAYPPRRGDGSRLPSAAMIWTKRFKYR